MSWTEEQLDFFAEKKYLIVDQFLFPAEIAALRKMADEGLHSGQFKEAGVGKGSEQRVVKTERGDWIYWLDAQSDSAAIQVYWDRINQVQSVINRNFYLGLNDMEAHLAVYQSGGFYKKHKDRHQISSTRRVSFVLYLNETWKKNDGGELMIYLDGETVEVEPISGRLVVFMSELEHEVLETQVNRCSITGWAHQRGLI